MFYKNAVIYQFNGECDSVRAGLLAAVNDRAFQPCAKASASSLGFVPVCPGSDDLVHSAGGFDLVCLRHQKKIIPAAAVKELLTAEIDKRESEEDITIGHRARALIKRDIIDEILLTALSESDYTHAYIDANRGLLVIDTASEAVAGDIMQQLRIGLGSLPVLPVPTKYPPFMRVTSWLSGVDCPDDLSIGEDGVLIDPAVTGSRVDIKRKDLSSDEITAHIHGGMMVSMLLLSFRDVLDFKIAFSGDCFSLKRLTFSDAVLEQASVDAGDLGNKAAEFDADFALMTAHLGDVFDLLCESFDGRKDIGWAA